MRNVSRAAHHLNKGIDYFHGSYNEAIRSFDKAIQLNPEDFYAWNSKGIAFNELSQYQKALDAFNKAVSIDPTNEEARLNKEIFLKKTENICTNHK